MDKEVKEVETVLPDYVTVAELINEFNKNWRKKGFYFTSEYQMNDLGNGVIWKTKVFDNEHVAIATGHALEEKAFSEFNERNFFENGETSAVGRALRALGVIESKHVATLNEVENRGGKKKITRSSEEALEALKRLKLDFISDENSIVVDESIVTNKKREIIERYGFVKKESSYVFLKQQN